MAFFDDFTNLKKFLHVGAWHSALPAYICGNNEACTVCCIIFEQSNSFSKFT